MILKLIKNIDKSFSLLKNSGKTSIKRNKREIMLKIQIMKSYPKMRLNLKVWSVYGNLWQNEGPFRFLQNLS